MIYSEVLDGCIDTAAKSQPSLSDFKRRLFNKVTVSRPQRPMTYLTAYFITYFFNKAMPKLKNLYQIKQCRELRTVFQISLRRKANLCPALLFFPQHNSFRHILF